MTQGKLFCVLEQGALPNQDITLEHKRQFNKPYCDFFRVNWWTHKDPNAQWTLKRSQVTETRNFLYEKTRNRYEYYIFADDDIRFSTPDGADVAETIKSNLVKYRPVLAGFFSPRRWKVGPHPHGGRVVRCGFVNDMDCMVLSADYAEICYPTIYHGADWTHDYMFYLALALCPEKYHIYLNVNTENTRYHWLDPETPCNYVSYECHSRFLKLARPEHRQNMADYFELRERAFSNKKIKRSAWGMLFNDACRPSSGLRRLALQDVSGVMDTEHPDFVDRRPLLRITDRQKWRYLATVFARRTGPYRLLIPAIWRLKILPIWRLKILPLFSRGK